VLAAGSQVNFFNTPGAEANTFPMYSLTDAERLRSRILALLEEAEREPKLIEEGALNFVIVSGGATGCEVAGALAEMIHSTVTAEYEGLAVNSRAFTLSSADLSCFRLFLPEHTNMRAGFWVTMA